LGLAADPTALAPESLLVFEVRESVQNFLVAARKVTGLDFIDTEEFEGDADDKKPALYLFVPDETALKQIESLWRRWERGESLGEGFTPWRDVFDTLRALRRWGPQDRVTPEEGDILIDLIDGRPDDELVRLEIELIWRKDPEKAAAFEAETRQAVIAAGGAVLTLCRIEDIAYHAILVDLPVSAVREIIAKSFSSIAGLNPVMHIRPQSLASSIAVNEQQESAPQALPLPDKPPILALLDGVPYAGHGLLQDRLTVDDLLDLEDGTPVAQRRHGTAMASLIVHGDRNRTETPLPRRIFTIPVTQWDGWKNESFPQDRLIIDMIYQAVTRLRAQDDGEALDIVIVNLSLGNERRPFHGQMSPWARLLDRLAWRYGLLFIVSAGNDRSKFIIPGYTRSIDYEDAAAQERATATLHAINNLKAQRRIISPAESINALTVGAVNVDAVPAHERRTPGINIEPYCELLMSNPSSRLGPGFANSTKPDIFFPGAREHLRISTIGAELVVEPAPSSRAFGLKVAAPSPDGLSDKFEGYSGATSAAAALASRTAHRIHDALEEEYGEEFITLTSHQRAVVLKALSAHTARWPKPTADWIKSIIGPPDNRQHVRQKDNIRRFLGYGVVDADEAVACAADRATFWAVGVLEPKKSAMVEFPLPACLHGKAKPHAVWATLAWLTPVRPGRNAYRAVKLLMLDPSEAKALRVEGASDQPDANQIKRGTLISRRWSGDKSPVIVDGQTCRLTIQREPDQGETVDEAVPFGLAVSLAMPGENEIYQQVRQKLTEMQALQTPIRA
jgi:hypothetical protein